MCRPRHRLVVEDDLSIRELLRLHLSIAGYRVDEIDNGKEALARAVTSRYDHCHPGRAQHLERLSSCQSFQVSSLQRHPELITPPRYCAVTVGW